MDTPAVTQIMDMIGARLKNIRTGNGYAFTLKKIERGRMSPWTSGDLPACNYWPAEVSNARTKYGMDTRSLSLYVEIHAQTRDEAFSDVADRLAAAVVVALNRDTSSPKTGDAASDDLGETVTALVFMGYDYEIGEAQAPWCGALVKFRVEYDTDLNDMDTF